MCDADTEETVEALAEVFPEAARSVAVHERHLAMAAKVMLPIRQPT